MNHTQNNAKYYIPAEAATAAGTAAATAAATPSHSTIPAMVVVN